MIFLGMVIIVGAVWLMLSVFVWLLTAIFTVVGGTLIVLVLVLAVITAVIGQPPKGPPAGRR
jgi:hypothetical protein